MLFVQQVVHTYPGAAARKVEQNRETEKYLSRDIGIFTLLGEMQATELALSDH